MKCTLIVDQERLVTKTVGKTTRLISEVVPAGTLVDHPEAALKCQVGAAIPADDECAFAISGLMLDDWLAANPNTVAALRQRYAPIAVGIHPEHLALFHAGKITGYRPDYDKQTDPPSREFLHGPNWTDEDAAAFDGPEEDDDEAVDHDHEAAA